MKRFLSTIFLSFLLISPVVANYYEDWPDDAVCLWLEERPEDKLLLIENKKRNLNCFEREGFSLRNYVYVPLEMHM
tara:strand:- start:408 stop:635 length:228 start_codon:yes stop_codon:yes gene_type:complete